MQRELVCFLLHGYGYGENVRPSKKKRPHSISPISLSLISTNSLPIIGRFNVCLPNDLSMGAFTRVLSRMMSPTYDKAVLTVLKNGRVVLDISGPKDSYEEDTDEEDDEEENEDHKIHKHIEGPSCDEYDDFVPRHPMAKGQHRRGDSYFNSDIDLYADQVMPQHTSSAFNKEKNKTPFSMQDLADAADDIDDNSPTNPNSVKNRLMQKKKSTMTFNKYPGITRSFHERKEAGVTSVDSDEEK